MNPLRIGQIVTTESLQAEGKCGKMIHTRGFDLGHGAAYCAEVMPCQFHTKGDDGLTEIERKIKSLTPNTK